MIRRKRSVVVIRKIKSRGGSQRVAPSAGKERRFAPQDDERNAVKTLAVRSSIDARNRFSGQRRQEALLAHRKNSVLQEPESRLNNPRGAEESSKIDSVSDQGANSGVKSWSKLDPVDSGESELLRKWRAPSRSSPGE